MFQDPAEVQMSVDAKLKTPSGRRELQHVIAQLLEKNDVLSTKSDKEIEMKARQIILHKALTGSLFSANSEKVSKQAVLELEARLAEVNLDVDAWAAKKEQRLKSEKQKERKKKVHSKKQKGEREIASQHAFRRWKESKIKQKYVLLLHSICKIKYLIL